MSAPDAPQFDEPWQAQVFAMTVLMHERGLFSWSEWTEMLGAEIKAGPQEAGNEIYFQCWLSAFEKLLVARGVAQAGEIGDLAQAWRDAAEATPHGQPIVLDADHHHDHDHSHS